MEFTQKEVEIRRLKKQLAQVEADLHRPTEAPASYTPLPQNHRTLSLQHLNLPTLLLVFLTILMIPLLYYTAHLLCSIDLYLLRYPPDTNLAVYPLLINPKPPKEGLIKAKKNAF